MKKTLLSLAGVVLVLAGGVYLVRAPLWAIAAEKLTENMFIEADTDGFDPGLRVGQSFPAISAIYQGSEINSVDQFISDKGMVFIANRSADW